MINLNLFFWSYLFIFSYVYVEIFYSLLFVSIFKSLKSYNINFSKKIHYYLFKNQIFQVTLNLNIIYLLSLKIDYCNTNILSFILVYLLLSKLFYTYTNYNILFVNFNIVLFLIFILYINSIVVFFLFIEFYSILFYFFFLNNIKKLTSTTLLQFKNMLLLYLVNNFFVTILFLFGLNAIIEQYGTANFVELNYFNTQQCSWSTYSLFIAFILKLALPGFHFLKLEIYKYLNNTTVIIYSVITLFINYLLMIFFFTHNFMFNILVTFKLPNLMILLVLFVFMNKLKLTSFQEFIAYSGFATNNLILLAFVI